MTDATIPGQATTQVTDPQPAGAVTPEPTLKELNEQFLAMKAQAEKAAQELEISKKEIAGLNRKNSEYEKAIQAKELEKLSEKERAEAELEIKRKEKEQLDNEIKNLSRSRVVDKVLFENNIPPDFADRIKGETEEEIIKDVKALNDYINKLVEERKTKEINAALGGRAPVAGNTAGKQIITRAEFNQLTPDKQREVAVKYQITD